MNTLPENEYTKQTLHRRLGTQRATDLLVRRLSYAETFDIDGQKVIVTRRSTVEFPNDTMIYKVTPV